MINNTYETNEYKRVVLKASEVTDALIASLAPEWATEPPMTITNTINGVMDDDIQLYWKNSNPVRHQVVEDSYFRKLVLVDGDYDAEYDITPLAPEWATHLPRRTDKGMVTIEGKAVSVWQKNKVAYVWDKFSEGMSEVVTDTDVIKLVIIPKSEATVEAIEAAAPSWADEENVTINSTEDAAINIRGNLVSMFEVNSVAFLWQRKPMTTDKPISDEL